ncbi:MAG: YkgJ family cysteine cluster protein [Selenomonadaceae bacterium]|nr:YkgJ family cysteine cluster protein [Selenomonadaceae bacterium]MBR1858590.1 YkgJ family cysteine cluster protein [Selenomonadaceae bacterium]
MFPCEKCGCCCRQIGKVFFAKSMALPDDSCKYLNKNTNLCTIYENRPIFCRVDDYYDKYYSKEMSRDEFYAQNKAICKKFQSNK